MNDPHVVSLTYKIIEEDGFKFNDPPDVEVDTPDFKGRLSQGVLTLEPKDHFESEAHVRPRADEFLRGWEITAALHYGRSEFHFRFQGSSIVDRQAGPGKHFIDLSDNLHMSMTVNVEKYSASYPAPPDNFRLTPEVEVIWNRYSRYIEGKEPLPSMAYSCLTFLERDKHRELAAKDYGIEIQVLKTLGELTTNRGDVTTARKFKPPLLPLSSSEQTWIESTIKAIIVHLASKKPDHVLKMTDLPPLT